MLLDTLLGQELVQARPENGRAHPAEIIESRRARRHAHLLFARVSDGQRPEFELQSHHIFHSQNHTQRHKRQRARPSLRQQCAVDHK